MVQYTTCDLTLRMSEKEHVHSFSWNATISHGILADLLPIAILGSLGLLPNACALFWAQQAKPMESGERGPIQGSAASSARLVMK
jgi:hypothetical protein